MSRFSAIFTLIVSFLILSISVADEYNSNSTEILTAFEKAGENSVELQKTIDHYQKIGDTQKTSALFFLLANMEEQSYATYRLFDTAGTDVNLDVLSFLNYDSLTIAVRKIENERGEVDYEKTELIYDLQHITAQFLINQIDYAFKAWTEKPWAKNFDFTQFCRYILPYRGSNEPLEEWRKYFYDKYAYITDSMINQNDPLEAAAIINDDIKTWFGFDPRYYYHPTDQGLSEMLESKLGRCEDMTNITIYAMRANGLAVTSDYTPYWANSGNNHAWNAIVTADGDVIPFMGAETSPGSYKLSGKVGKVYRKTYDQQKDNLVFQVPEGTEIPRWLKGKNYMDVTADYTDVADVEMSVLNVWHKSDTIPYLCVFNSGEWKPIHWGEVVGSWDLGPLFNFSDMGKGIVYLPALYLDNKVTPVRGNPPFLLDKDGEVVKLLRKYENPKTIQLYSTTKKKIVKSSEGIILSHFETGKEYELFYWSGSGVGWGSYGKQTAIYDKPLIFENVSIGELYWLVAEDSDKEERIFTIDEDGNQVFW